MNCLLVIRELMNNWKNIVIMKRLDMLDHILVLAVRVLGLQEVISWRECGESMERLDRLQDEYGGQMGLPLVDNQEMISRMFWEILQLTSLLQGGYDITVEIYLAEIALLLLKRQQNGIVIGQQHEEVIDALLLMTAHKLEKKCGLILLMDYHYDYFLSLMTRIYKCLFSQYREDGGQVERLQQGLQIVNHLLNCDHFHDVIQSNAKTNSVAAFILQLKEKNISKKQGEEQDIIKSNTRYDKYEQSMIQIIQETKFQCKNICAEIKNGLLLIAHGLLTSIEDIGLFLQFAKQSSINYQLNIHMTRLLHLILMNDKSLMKMFNESGGPAVFLHLVLAVYRTGQESLLYKGMGMLLDLSANKVILSDCVFLMESAQQGQQMNTLLSQVVLVNGGYLQGVMSMVWQLELSDCHAGVLDMLNAVLMGQESNLRLFRQQGGVQFVYDVLLMKLEQDNQAAYLSVLSLFESLLVSLTYEEIDAFFETFLNNRIKTKLQSHSNDKILDLLSILAIHVLFNTNEKILDRILQSELYLNLLCFLDCQEIQFQEMALKIYTLFYIVGKQQKKKESMLLKLQNLFNLIKKMLNQIDNVSSQFCQSILSMINFNICKIPFFFPQKQGNVSVILNRSKDLGSKIIKNNEDNNQSVLVKQMVELLFIYLEKIINNPKGDSEQQDLDNTAQQILKSFNQLLDQPLIIQKMYDSNIMQWIQQFYNKVDSKFNKTKQQISEILIKLFEYDLQKSEAKKIKLVEMLKKIYNDRQFVVDVIRIYLQYIQEEPDLKRISDEDSKINLYLKNLIFLLYSVEDLVNVNEQLMLLMIECINLLTSKNSASIRKLIMSVGCFDFKDELLIQILKFEVKNAKLFYIFDGFQFKQLAQNSKFKKANGIVYLLKLFFEYQSNRNIQLQILNIFRQEMKDETDVCQQMAKIIENQDIHHYMFDQNKESNNNNKSECDLDDNDSESVNITKQFNNQMTQDQFIDLINSNQILYIKKQILLRIDNDIILVKNTNSQKTKQIEQKIIERQKKIEKQFEENLINEQFIIKEELRCSKLVIKNYEQFSKQFKDRKKVLQHFISEGNEIAFNIENNIDLQKFSLSSKGIQQQ